MKIMPYTTPVIINNSNVGFDRDENGDNISDVRVRKANQNSNSENESSVKSTQNFENTHTLDNISIIEIPNELQDKIDEINKQIAQMTNVYKDIL